jgi:hypothetical protein
VSMDPSTIQSLLVQKLGQGAPAPGSYGGGAAGPQMQGQTSGANLMAQLAQKAMLMKALQSNQANTAATAQANNMLPTTNAQIANDPTINALTSGQMDPTILAQLQSQQPAVATAGAPQ